MSLRASAGTVVSVIGPNGSGKSTLLRCLARQLPKMSGDILIDGRSVDTYGQKEFARRVSYMRQERDAPVISVERLALFGRFPYLGFPARFSEADREIARQAMRRAGVLELADRNLPDISGGEAQRAYLAMALAQEAEILLMDEPTTHLDISHQRAILSLLRELAGEGKTIFVVAHDINNAARVSDHILVMDRGRFAFSGAPADLADSSIIMEVFGVPFDIRV